MEEAMQTMPPIESAVTKYFGPVQPTKRKTRQVRSSVATVMPEIGLEEDPISPVRREETVTKRKPKPTMRSAPRRFHCRCSCGTTMMTRRRAMQPPMTNFIDKSWSVRGALALCALPPRRSLRPPFNPCQMVGRERNKLMMPPAATAPAPM